MEKNEKIMLTADDVAKILDIKVSRAYAIIRQLNAELAANGKLVLRGRVNREYLLKKISSP
ncbi:DNA-binding protein [Megasphaera elsdenii]|uniref:DNA-binding protein n=1 Tax=Megasphaera elsdenii TaxID=907 RepID=UPI0024332D1A|nr:DNA-binding protein [Megasphaera elsdenii]